VNLARAGFDELLLNEARAAGAEVARGSERRAILEMTDGAVSVSAAAKKFRGKYLLDASGQGTLVGRHLGNASDDRGPAPAQGGVTSAILKGSSGCLAARRASGNHHVRRRVVLVDCAGRAAHEHRVLWPSQIWRSAWASPRTGCWVGRWPRVRWVRDRMARATGETSNLGAGGFQLCVPALTRGPDIFW